MAQMTHQQDQMADYVSIPKFYADKSILVTGATGFIGKVLIWKLLQYCPLLEKVYILVRARKGKNIDLRRIELINCPIFDNFRKEGKSDILEKIIAISGDIGHPNLGISDSDMDLLINEVSIVFYSAALLKMDASLKEAIAKNTEAVIEGVEISKRMKKLEAFLYVSTAYCCCNESEVEEKLYPMSMDPHDVIKLVHNLSEKALKKITADLIEPLPNSYTFSKRVTEVLLRDYEGKVPIIIIRPSIVVNSMFEPIPGWVDTLNGPVGVAVATGKGVLRVILADPDKRGNMIPVDLVCNGLISIPWREVQKHDKMPTIPVYNLASDEHQGMTWRQFQVYCEEYAIKYPFELILWYPTYDVIEKNKYIYQIKAMFYHTIPAMLIDSLLFLLRQKPFMMRVMKKITNGIKVLAYFSCKQWVFQNGNMKTMEELMSAEDKSVFQVSQKDVNYHELILHGVLATKKYFFKEDLNNVEWCRMKLKGLYILKIIVMGLFYYFAVKMFLRMIDYDTGLGVL